MKLEQAVLSNACHESEFFSLQYYYEYYPKFSLNRSTTYTHTRVHTRIRTEYLFNSFQLCFIIIVHSCTCMYRREETNAFEILSTLNKTLFEFVVSNSSMFELIIFNFLGTYSVEIFVSLFSRIIVIVKSTRQLFRCEDFKRI